jgi:leader peptidase (prepilin peptidase)/N-methyltransferase
MIEWLGISIAFVLGAVVGSFMNVCIWRMPRDESVVSPGSHCPACNTPLQPRDLVPMLSFLVQGRKCRYCGKPITWRYFLVELLTAGYFAFSYWWFVRNGEPMEYVNFLAFSLFGASLIATFFIDLEHFIIPDQLNLFGIAIGVCRNIAEIALSPDHSWRGSIAGREIPLPQSVIGIIICGGIFFLIAVISCYVFRKDAMGGGDIKLAAAVGANLTLVSALFSFILAVLLGSLIGVALIALKKKSRKDYVPFGPMMVAGAFIAIFFGRELIQLYCNYAGI